MPEYIDRGATIAVIENVLRGHKDARNSIAYFAFEMFAKLLKAAPVADVEEVRHGYWHRKHIGNGWDDWDALTCSVCKKHYKKPDFPTNYCPNCGAKMDLKEGTK